MADLTKTIDIIFGATDNASGTVKTISDSFNEFETSLSSITDPIAGFTSDLLKAEAAIVAIGTAALFYSHSQASQMEDAQSSLNKVLGESEGVAADYAEAIKEISLQYGVAGSSVTGAVADFKQAGFTISESLSLVDAALTGVRIAELSAEESGRLLISNIRGLGAEAEDAAHFMDAWNEVSNLYAATAKEVAIATGELAPIAKTAGLTFDELVGFVTPIIEVFGSGSEAANALKVSLASLNTEEKGVVDSLKELGIAQKDTNGELRVAGDILKDLGNIWPSLTESQQANYAIQLFGKEQYARMSVVLNDYDKVLKITTISEEAAGSAKKELAIALDKASVATERFVVAFNSAAVVVGGQFIANTTGATNSLTELFKAIDKVVSENGLEPLFNVLNEMIDEFSNNIDSIAGNLPEAFKGADLDGLANSFRDLGNEVSEAFNAINGGSLDLSTVEGLTEGLQRAVNIIEYFVDVTSGIILGLRPIWEGIGAIGDGMNNTSKDAAKTTGELLAAITLLSEFGLKLGGALVVIEKSGATIKDVWDVIAGATKISIAGIQASFSLILSSVVDLVTGMAKIGEAVTFGDTNEKAQALIADLENLGAALDSQVTKKAQDARDASSQLSDGLNGEAKAAQEAAQAQRELGNATEKAIEPTKELAKDVDEFAGAVEVIPSTIPKATVAIDNLGEATEKTDEAQKGIVKTIVDGIPTFTQSAEAIKDIAEAEEKAAEETAKLALEYAKLETDMEKIASNERIKSMEFFVDLEIAQVESDAKKVVAAFESIADSYTATSNLISDLYGNSGDLSGLDKLDLERSIKKAEDLAQDQWETQKALLEAQTESIEAQAERANRGDSLITVDGGSLQPELEAIMQSLFKSIRISMSADYENYLLGLG